MEEPDVIFKSKLRMKRTKEILEEVKCLKCKNEEKFMVYLPCALIAECFSCSRKSQLCTICGNFIETKNPFVSSVRSGDCTIFAKLAYSPITSNYGAIASRTAVDFFPFCGAIAFFFSSPKKELHLKDMKSCNLILKERTNFI